MPTAQRHISVSACLRAARSERRPEAVSSPSAGATRLLIYLLLTNARAQITRRQAQRLVLTINARARLPATYGGAPSRESAYVADTPV